MSGVLQRIADALSRMSGLTDTMDQDNLETNGHMKDVDDLYHSGAAVTLKEGSARGCSPSQNLRFC